MLLTFSVPVKSATNDQLTDTIDSIIYESLPQGTDIALMIYDLTNDTILYAYRVPRILTSSKIIS